jgi:hypothetical protein
MVSDFHLAYSYRQYEYGKAESANSRDSRRLSLLTLYGLDWFIHRAGILAFLQTYAIYTEAQLDLSPLH